MMISRPDSSMQVSTTLAFTDSETPMKLITARATMNSTATAAITQEDTVMSNDAGR
jgi:hypothetical protein